MFLPVVSFYSLCTLRAFWVLVGVPSSACVLCCQVTKVLISSLLPLCSFQRTPCQRGVPRLLLPAPSKGDTQERQWLSFPLFSVSKSHSLYGWPYTFQGHAVTGSCPVLRSWIRAGSSYLEQSLNSVPWARQPIKGPGDRRGSDSRQEPESPPHSFHQLYQERCVHSERRIRGTGINSRSRTGKPGNMPPFQEA